jgi:hypothetical protein
VGAAINLILDTKYKVVEPPLNIIDFVEFMGYYGRRKMNIYLGLNPSLEQDLISLY